MTGYSGAPLVTKLGIKPESVVRVMRGPRDLHVAELLGPLPSGARLTDQKLAAQADIVICLVETDAQLRRQLPRAMAAITKDGVTWMWWPKKSSERFKHGTGEVSEDTIRALALQVELLDVKVCAVDATWSGLKLVYRLKNR